MAAKKAAKPAAKKTAAAKNTTTPTKLDRINVSDYELWGKLVKTWATGKDYVKNGKSYLPKPTSIDELKKQCKAAGITITIPTRYTGDITYAQGDEHTVLIRLPPAALVADSEKLLGAEGTVYSLPPFYKRIFQNVDPLVPSNQKLKVHAERIGDYSMSACM